MLITVNSKTTGKFRKRKINGRDHIITQMKPIRGDIAMNRRFYPNTEIQKSFMQFNNLIAPAGHPMVNGQSVSAYHPLALNVNNVGGFLQNPRMKGKDVIVDFALDVERAESSDEGKEILSRIENKESIGVSTGLIPGGELQQTGTDDFGKTYTTVVSNIKFDHVAILPEDEEPAGAHAGTNLLLNSELNQQVEIINLDKMVITNELSVNDLREQLESLLNSESTNSPNTFKFINDIFPDSRKFVFSVVGDGNEEFFTQTYAIDDSDTVSLLNDRKQVIRQVTFEDISTNQEDEAVEMDKDKFLMSLIVNGLSIEKAELDNLTEEQLAKKLTEKPTVDEAKAILVNSNFDLDGYQSFVENKNQFEVFIAEKNKKLDEIKAQILGNSEMTKEMLTNKSEVELEAISALITKKPAPRLPASNGMPATKLNGSGDAEVACNYNF